MWQLFIEKKDKTLETFGEKIKKVKHIINP
jgi:hypothetical protein